MKTIAQLSDRFRVVLDERRPPQWLLQRRSGKNWQNTSYCQTKAGLMLAIRIKSIDHHISTVSGSGGSAPCGSGYPGLLSAGIALCEALPDRAEVMTQNKPRSDVSGEALSSS